MTDRILYNLAMIYTKRVKNSLGDKRSHSVYRRKLAQWPRIIKIVVLERAHIPILLEGLSTNGQQRGGGRCWSKHSHSLVRDYVHLDEN
jgi:hypothetical protein